jgi:hypothetical protein
MCHKIVVVSAVLLGFLTGCKTTAKAPAAGGSIVKSDAPGPVAPYTTCRSDTPPLHILVTVDQATEEPQIAQVTVQQGEAMPISYAAEMYVETLAPPQESITLVFADYAGALSIEREGQETEIGFLNIGNQPQPTKVTCTFTDAPAAVPQPAPPAEMP